MGVWFSCLSHTSVPNAAATCGHRYCGVGGTSGARKRAADSIALRGRAGRSTRGNRCHGGAGIHGDGNIRPRHSTVTVQLTSPNHPTGPLIYMSLRIQAGSPPARTARRASRAAHRNTCVASRHAPAFHPQLRRRIARQPLDGGRGLRSPDRRGTDRIAPRLGFLRAPARQQAGAAHVPRRIPCPAPCST